MSENELRALRDIQFEWAPTQEDVWFPPESHVEGLHGSAIQTVLEAMQRAERSSGTNPLGVVIEGQPGSGKTHLLSWIREQVQGLGGFFFLLGMPQEGDFAPIVVQAFLEGFGRPATNHRDQLTMLLDGLASRAMVSKELRDRIVGLLPLTSDGLEDFVSRVTFADRRLSLQHKQTLRALVMLATWDDHLQDLGEGFLTSMFDEDDADEWARWHLPTKPRPAVQVIKEISYLISMIGPSLLAIDQIDPAFAQVRRSVISHGAQEDSTQPYELNRLAASIGHGLMDTREQLSRTVIVASCLTSAWDLICDNTLTSLRDRFRYEARLQRIPSRAVGMELVASRFAPRFADAGFSPPFPTWPIAPSAFDSVRDYTPRGLLQRVDAHVRRCLRSGTVSILTDLERPVAEPVELIMVDNTVGSGVLDTFDRKLEIYRNHASVSGALDQDLEDKMMPDLLVAGLQAWVREKDDEERKRFSVFAGAGGSPTAHATLKETFDADMDDYGLWYFRGLAKLHHSAVLPRVERVMRLAALDPKVPHRRAVLLRNVPWPNGPASKAKREKFEALGGLISKVSQDDLRTFHALGRLLDEDEPFLDVWLADRKPASGTTLFAEIFGPPPEEHAFAIEPDVTPDDSDSQPAGASEVPADSVPIGFTAESGDAAHIELAALRKHVAIFAGSGSGKTVLIRRLIEECALQGVSTIALDPNNDLARLGDPWPEAPTSWLRGDEQAAAAYFDQTEVMVWTPRRESGRPLSLQPLPDFKAVLGDPDELELALDSAVAALAPRARVGGNTSKMDRGRAVLREALAYYARKGGSHLTGFVDMLADLPEGVTSLDKASELAYDMAQTLTAAMINDPLFGGSGVPLDPGVLLTPGPGKRARISVISLIGLPTTEQRQSFVNQLQMALFAWIKLNPANDRPLGGLFVMDEAQTLAPSGAMTACTESTLALASQARKYGLGLVFATQAPRGIHNRIVGNAATQFYGFLNSPVQIAAAKEMAQAKGSAVMDIARLTAGEFYAMGEGLPFRKLAIPMCLSHHPSGALTPEEILDRARAGA